MTNGVGEEKTISVSNNLIELIEHIKGINSLSSNDKSELLTMVTVIACQVNGIHDKLEGADMLGWSLERALDNIADELYYNGWYVNEV
ncbi:DNA binding protein [Bacillus phage Blastoid]|uniref:DNA binding protein n=1 Tax=Bacillus phage Blastoid TaxID=2880540 RepID=U5PSW8_9CAUD|nr:DNA binding protein [Bacillus phage Blastoid]AGY46851.1 DNA binding protein [Bacillus phage Blastoid]